MPECHGEAAAEYAARIASEKDNYRDCLDVHALPEIFHYWSNRYVRPKLEAFGFSTPDELFRKFALEQFRNGRSGARRLASIGAGNCQLEVDLAVHLSNSGYGDFIVDCLELNPDMLERGRLAAAQAGVEARMNFMQVDLNEWRADHEYDVTMANQTLHHVLNLENLFAQVGSSLKPDGSFVISDMIGRNRHQRWPEALALVREFWRKLPPSYRFNPGSNRYEEVYEDWDCYGDDFEGIRAQDILPLLIGQFHFELFIAFANIIDPFVGRAFGSNYDPAAGWDRDFIDQVHARDEQEIAAGRIKPTHVLAVMGNTPRARTLLHEPLTPEFCLRDPSRAPAEPPVANADGEPAYEWGTWPHSDRRELEIACRRLKQLHEQAIRLIREVDERTQWALRMDQDVKSAARTIEGLNRDLEERNQWARNLEQELKTSAGRIQELDRELEDRTRWAGNLEQELKSSAGRIRELDLELEDRTQWARSLERELKSAIERIAVLDRELEDRTQWARNLEQELKSAAGRIQELESQLGDRTRWGQSLERELAARTLAHTGDMERLAWAQALDGWLHTPLDGAFRALRGVVHGVRRMLPGGRH